MSEATARKTCPTCSHTCAPEATFCTRCGSTLPAAATPAAGDNPGIAALGTPRPTPSFPAAPRPAGYVQAPPPQNGYAVASLVLGILGLSSMLCGVSAILSILAIIFGAIGRKKAKLGLSNNGGMATAGLVMGVIGAVLGIGALIYVAVAGDW